jgi:hypothetical protein
MLFDEEQFCGRRDSGEYQYVLSPGSMQPGVRSSRKEYEKNFSQSGRNAKDRV